MKNCRLIGKIVKVEGECVAGHRVGEEFDLTVFSEETDKLHRTPSVCGFLYNASFPTWLLYSLEAPFHGKKRRTSFSQAAQTITK